MLYNPSDKLQEKCYSQAEEREGIDLARARMVGRVESLAQSIFLEYKSNRSGIARAGFLRIANEYLMTDPADSSFSDLHRSYVTALPSELVNLTQGYDPISVGDFETFLREQGPAIIENYKDKKWRGWTGCGPIATNTTELLNEMAKNCADIEGISHHAFNLVLVETQPYLLDFTFDQFLDYEGVKNRQGKFDDPVAYSGILIMPVDRMAFKFDKVGNLVDLH